MADNMILDQRGLPNVPLTFTGVLSFYEFSSKIMRIKNLSKNNWRIVYSRANDTWF